MSSATKRILGVGVVEILMIIVAFVGGVIIGTDNATTASSAFLDMLFIGGLGAIFGAIFAGIFKKTSAHVKSVLGIVGLVVALFCQSSHGPATRLARDLCSSASDVSSSESSDHVRHTSVDQISKRPLARLAHRVAFWFNALQAGQMCPVRTPSSTLN